MCANRKKKTWELGNKSTVYEAPAGFHEAHLSTTVHLKETVMRGRTDK